MILCDTNIIIVLDYLVITRITKVWIFSVTFSKGRRAVSHEIVRAQKKVSKGHPNTTPKSCPMVTDSQV